MDDTVSAELGQKIKASLARKDWATAAVHLEQWCRMFPDHLPGWHRRALCLASLGRFAEAHACALKATQLDPHHDAVRKLLHSIKKRLPSPAHTATKAAVAGDAGEAPETEIAAVPATEVGDNVTESSQSLPPTEIDEPDQTVGSEAPATMAAVSPREQSQAPPETVLPEDEARRSTAVSRALWTKGSIIENRYEVLRVARGGMGEVYIVRDREMGLKVAVKTPLPSVLATEAGRARFLREAEAWIALGLHPNICAAFYVSPIGGIPRLFIEYIDGGDLAHWMRRRPDASAAQLTDLAIQIASGMLHAHTFEWQDEDGAPHRGLVHRDLKPANILLGSNGLARVTDFGLVGKGFQSVPADDPNPAPARGESAEIPISSDGVWGTMTIGGIAMGTPPYMPPEQWDGAHHAGESADIYAFGCILYELFCGRRPFALPDRFVHAQPEAKRLQWEEMHRNQQAPDPQSITPSLDPQLSEVIFSCVAKQAGDRPSNFEFIRAELVSAYQRLAGKTYPRPAAAASRLLADSLNNRGVSFHTLGQSIRAQHAWDEALAADPHHIEASFNLALTGWRHGGVSDAHAMRRMDEVRQTQVASWRDEHLSGKLALVLGDFETAAARLRDAFDASEGIGEVARDLAMALCALATREDIESAWTEIIDLISGSCSQMTRDPVVLTIYALASQRLQQSTKATRAYAKAHQALEALPQDIEDGAEYLLPGLHLKTQISDFIGQAKEVAISGDGRTALSLGNDAKIVIWDLVSHATRSSIKPSGPRTRVMAIDGSGAAALIAADADQMTEWNLETGMVAHRFAAHPGFLNQIVFSPDGDTIGGVTSTGAAVLWSFEDRSLRKTWQAHTGFGTAIAIAADRRHFVTGGSDNTVAIWESSTDEPISRLTGHTGAISRVAISRGAKTAASASEDLTIRVWDIPSRTCTAELRGHAAPVTFLALHEHGPYLLSTAADNSLRIWDLSGQKVLMAYQFPGGVVSAAATADWSSIIVALGSSMAHLSISEITNYQPALAVSVPVTVSEASERSQEFLTKIDSAEDRLANNDHRAALALAEEARSISGYERIPEALELAERIGAGFPRARLNSAWEERVFQDHGDRVLDVAIDPAGEKAISTDGRRRLLLWELRTGHVCAEMSEHQLERAVAIDASGKRAVSGGLDGNLRSWSLTSGECEATFGGHEAGIHHIALDPTGQIAITAGADERAHIWDLEKRVSLHVLEGHSREVLCAAISPDGIHAVTGGDDGGLIMWEIASGQPIRSFEGHSGPVNAVVWSLDGRFLVSGGNDRSIRYWRTDSGALLRTFESQHRVTSVAMTADGTTCLAGTQTGTVELWTIRNRQQIRSFSAHSDPVSRVVLTATGERAVSASSDGTVRVWYLDWEPEIRPAARWDDKATPYLEVFLRRSAGPAHTKPVWSDEDFRSLVQNLRNSGFGWLSASGVKHQLETMAAEWSRRTKPTETGGTRNSKRASEAITPKMKAARKLKTRIGIALLILAVPIVSYIHHYRSSTRIDFNQESITESRRMIRHNVIPVPKDITDSRRCNEASVDHYLKTFTSATDDPWVSMGARYCLEQLHKAHTVAPILEMMAPRQITIPGTNRTRPSRVGDFTRQEVISALVRMGESIIPELEEGLSHREPQIRRTAADVLAFQSSDRSIMTLIRLCRNRDPDIRTAASRTLPEIISSRILDPGQALDLLDGLAEDGHVEIRRNTASALRMLTGTRAKKLARKMTLDVDRKVAKLATDALNGM